MEDSNIRTAVCDERALLSVHSLLDGPFEDFRTLSQIERVFRAHVLYDETQVVRAPQIYYHEMDEELHDQLTKEEYGITVVSRELGVDEVDSDVLANQCQERLQGLKPRDLLPADAIGAINEWESDLVTQYEHPDENVNRIATYIGSLLAVVNLGGSPILEGELERRFTSPTLKYPEKLFAALDNEWGDLVRRLEFGDVGLVVPPISAIVLTRASNREAIPHILRELRDEWSRPRARLWAAVETFQKAKTTKEAYEAIRGLEHASTLMMPTADFPRLFSFRNFWGLATAVLGGALGSAATGENPASGAIEDGVSWFADLVTSEFGNLDLHLRRGAFDLSREVHNELAKVPRVPELLSSILTTSERQAVGLV